MTHSEATQKWRLSFRLHAQFPRERELMEHLQELRARQVAPMLLQFILRAFDAQQRGDDLPSLGVSNWPWSPEADDYSDVPALRVIFRLHDQAPRERDLAHATLGLSDERRAEVLRSLALHGFAMDQMISSIWSGRMAQGSSAHANDRSADRFEQQTHHRHDSAEQPRARESMTSHAFRSARAPAALPRTQPPAPMRSPRAFRPAQVLSKGSGAKKTTKVKVEVKRPQTETGTGSTPNSIVHKAPSAPTPAAEGGDNHDFAQAPVVPGPAFISDSNAQATADAQADPLWVDDEYVGASHSPGSEVIMGEPMKAPTKGSSNAKALEGLRGLMGGQSQGE